MKKKNTSYKIVVFIFIIIFIFIGVLITKDLPYEKTNTQNIENTQNFETIEQSEYENLNIDKELLNIFYLNVGQADCTLITLNGYNMLIDSGNDQDGYYIWKFLEAQNINTIDYFIVTHFDEDHMGGAYKILEKMTIGVLYMPNNTSKTQTYKKFIQTIENNNINVDRTLVASNETTYSLGSASWKVLNINDGNNLNDSSIVVQLNYKETKYLFMGDATENVEKNNKITWEEVDALKVGHHGASESTCQDFLAKIKPKYAIISVGANNQHQHPKDDLLDRLENQKSINQIYRTDKNGTIWLISDGSEIRIQTLDYNIDGTGRKQAYIFERKYLYAFFLNSINRLFSFFIKFNYMI